MNTNLFTNFGTAPNFEWNDKLRHKRLTKHMLQNVVILKIIKRNTFYIMSSMTFFILFSSLRKKLIIAAKKGFTGKTYQY